MILKKSLSRKSLSQLLILNQFPRREIMNFKKDLFLMEYLKFLLEVM